MNFRRIVKSCSTQKSLWIQARKIWNQVCFKVKIFLETLLDLPSLRELDFGLMDNWCLARRVVVCDVFSF